MIMLILTAGVIIGLLVLQKQGKITIAEQIIATLLTIILQRLS